tara:strand:- start:109 stop:783 length:675 start_codon:yes stop_codon:yes gene_type:complete
MKNDIILIDKPLNWTSFDVVKKIRGLIKQKYCLHKLKVGHAGTLDPLASGLLIICTGNKTKELREFQNLKKTYLATIKLGFSTDSFDRETQEKNKKEYKHISSDQIMALSERFFGLQNQTPPKYSALKINGKRAYQKARNNESFELESRLIHIYSLVIKKIHLPYIDFEVICSKGTYIRSLAHDIGTYLKCGAYLFNLKRLAIGKNHLDSSVDLETFKIMLDEV